MKAFVSKTRLYCPGPTPVSPKAQLALQDTNLYHRTSAFYDMIESCREGLALVFGCAKKKPIILTSSGTGAMEAAVVNLTSEGDEVCVIACGKFGERWEKILSSYGCAVHLLRIDDGSCPTPDEIDRFVKTKSKSKAVFFQANETSTGVALPVEAICKSLRRFYDGFIVVDAVSAMVAHPSKMDDWQIDCVVSGSQKGFGIPPGLSFIAISERASSQLSKRSRFYFDFARELKNQDDGQTAFTPAVNLISALSVALREIQNYGIENFLVHHKRMSEACRAASHAMGLEMFPKDHFSHAVSAIKVPSTLDGLAVVKSAREHDGCILAGGQDQLKGKIVRIAHLGFVDRIDLLGGIAALEFALREQNLPFELGAGVGAAMKVLSSPN